MRKEIIPYPKTKQTCREPKPKKSNKATGNDYEKAVRAQLQAASNVKVSRNHQGKEGGGISNPDISFGRWCIEVKNEKRLSIKEWLKTLLEETPPDKKPGLVYSVDGVPWISVRLEDRLNFANDLISAAGGEVYFE